MRRLAALVAGLPLDSALERSRDPHGAGVGWSTTEELLAVAIEVLDRADRHYVRANTKKGARQPKPLKVPRPRDHSAMRSRRPATVNELKQIVGMVGGARVTEEVPS